MGTADEGQNTAVSVFEARLFLSSLRNLFGLEVFFRGMELSYAVLGWLLGLEGIDIM